MKGVFRRAIVLPVIVLLLMGSLMAFPSTTFAATFEVTSLGDDVNTVGTLRWAVYQANATAGADIITFAPGLSGTITLANGALAIYQALEIQGPGAAVLTVSGNDASTVFEVVYGASATISGLSITHGREDNGGGIRNFGTLTLANSVIHDNVSSYRAGGIFNDGNLTVTNSTIRDNTSGDGGGGGVHNMDVLTVTNSTISGNSSTRGGGIHSEGTQQSATTLTITNSTVSGNIATFGGGIYNLNGTFSITDSTIRDNVAGYGGGIMDSGGGPNTIAGSTFSGNSATYIGGGLRNSSTLHITNSTLSGNTTGDGGAVFNNGTLTITSSTLSGNSAKYGAGVVNDFGTLTIINSTLSGNDGGYGGGVYNDSGTVTITSSTLSGNSAVEGGGGVNNHVGTLTLSASIVAVNTGLYGPDVVGIITDGGYNLLGSSASNSGLTHGVNGNLVGVGPLLGPLADNGGPTETRALLAGSPAIDHIPADGSAGCGTTILTDQRGIARPQGTGCDIGAYEYDVTFVQTYYQACLYAGSLTQVGFIGTSDVPTVNCGRGTPVVLLAGDDPAADTYYACLYAGSLSQVGTSEPGNCGRGMLVRLASGAVPYACLHAGSLSQVGFSQPASCGRGVLIQLNGYAVQSVR